MKIDIEKIAKNILLARTIKGFTQDGLVQAMGISQQWVQKVEKGEVNLTFEHINLLSETLGVTPEFLLFSSPSQVFNNSFNNSSLSRMNSSFNNCIINSPDFMKKIEDLYELIGKYCSKCNL
jgi:transcriptional regulator with XRE-family HTH domain